MSSNESPVDIRIGTSGWSYDDWVGPFYPEKMKLKKGDWLPYYGKFFDTVEINSTFYRMPNDWIVKRWVDVGKKLESFEFSLKLPQAVTHEAIVEGKEADVLDTARDFESKVVSPLAENGLLGCILIQLSPYFQRYDKKTKEDNLHRLEKMFKALNYSELYYVAEFRHSSWLNSKRDDLDAEPLKLLGDYNIGICKTDGPGFPATKTDSAAHGYIRFHGRNRDIWFKGEKAKKEKDKEGRFNRYDYLYTEEELEYWVPAVKDKVKKKGVKERIYFNNHPHGQAVQNAFMMMDLVGLPRKIKDFKIQKQHKIDFY